MAKSSRSSSVGEGTHTPPCSPCFYRGRRSFGETEAEPPLSASSPLSSAPPLLSCSQSSSSHPAAALSPSRPVQNVQPSRIPLPKQPLSPRRSLCLEVLPSCRVSTPTAGLGGDVAPGKQGWWRMGKRNRVGCSELKMHVMRVVFNFLFFVFLPSAVLVRHLSLTSDPVFPSSIPVRQKRDSLSERLLSL